MAGEEQARHRQRVQHLPGTQKCNAEKTQRGKYPDRHCDGEQGDDKVQASLQDKNKVSSEADEGKEHKRGAALCNGVRNGLFPD